jgi:hypothetical protein
MSDPAHVPLGHDFAGLRARLDLVELPDEEPISPELVLVDPELRSRLEELPAGPVVALPALAAGVEPPEAAEQPAGGRSFLASVACVCALVLALPVLAIAADLVRFDRPRLVPQPLPASGRVHVGLEQHVRSHPPLVKPHQIDRPG